MPASASDSVILAVGAHLPSARVTVARLLFGKACWEIHLLPFNLYTLKLVSLLRFTPLLGLRVENLAPAHSPYLCKAAIYTNLNQPGEQIVARTIE
jgi:hypothetical protein